MADSLNEKTRQDDDLTAIVASLVLLKQGGDSTIRFYLTDRMVRQFISSYLSTAVQTGAPTTGVETLARDWARSRLSQILPGVQKTISSMDQANFGTHAELITGTEDTAAASAGVRAAANGHKLVWVAIRDSKTDAVCISLNGTTDWANKYPSGPPIHPNCRCELAVAASR